MNAHAISITPHPSRVTITVAGQTIAATDRAIALKEGAMEPVLYLPREDADMAALEKSGHTSHCPFKGDASYYSIRIGDDVRENAVWTYENPIEAVAAIRDYLAFYPDRVDLVQTARSSS